MYAVSGILGSKCDISELRTHLLCVCVRVYVGSEAEMFLLVAY